MTDARTPQLRAGAATDIGRSRTVNQDRHLLLPERGLWMVADGMGGAQGGEVASTMAVQIVSEAFTDRTKEGLLRALTEANRRIHETAEADPDLRGMGTTAVALAVIPGDHAEDDDPEADSAEPAQLVVVNVGDSRAYLFRDGELVQLTEDHSVVGEMVREGRLTREEASVHPQRNIVTRVLGPYEQATADLWPVDAVRGDRFLLCSDGLFGEVHEDRIGAVLRRLEDPSEAATELVRLANEAGGRDNITVVVVDVVDDGGLAERASRALGDQPSHLESSPDMAGFSTALTGEGLSDDELDSVRRHDSDEPLSRKERRAERRAARKAKRSQRTRVTWRVLAFVVLLAVVLGGAFATIQWYGTSTYFVAFDGDEVAVFRGRPGGLLWIEPTLEDSTGIPRDEVPARYLAALEAGHEHSSLAQAQRYVSNIERDIARSDAATTTTTTTTSTSPPEVTTTTTTTAPVAN